MTIQSVQRADPSNQTLSIQKGPSKTCSKVILQLAIAALSILAGSLTGAIGLIPAVFAVTGVYGVITFGVMAATITSMFANYFFIRPLTQASEVKSAEAQKDEPVESIRKMPDTEIQEVSLEQFYKTLREKCRQDLIHSTQLVENTFIKSEKKQTLTKLSEDERAKHKTATLVLDHIKPKQSNGRKEKEFSRIRWKSIYNEYDRIAMLSLKINDVIKKRLSEVSNHTLSDKSTKLEDVRNSWMQAVQCVKRCQIFIEIFKSSRSKLKQYSEELQKWKETLCKTETEMDEWDEILVKGDKKYKKMLQSFSSKDNVGA
jgi:hypothetical protein